MNHQVNDICELWADGVRQTMQKLTNDIIKWCYWLHLSGHIQNGI